MARDARFWRNLAIIAAAHVTLLILLLRWTGGPAKANAQEIVWMGGGASDGAAPTPAPPSETKVEATPPPAPDEQEAPSAPPVSSDIQFPTPTPSPTPKPTVTPTPVPKASPKPSATPTPKATPKKTVVAKPTPKSSPKKEAATAEKKKQDNDAKQKEAATVAAGKTNPERTRNGEAVTGGDGSGRGPGKTSEFSWYGNMLHDRFQKEWAQPTSIVATGAKMSVVVKIRIEKDGRVSSFTIVKPSGNVVVDESVAAVAKRVTQVDPLPKGLGSRDYYEVNINFALNADK